MSLAITAAPFDTDNQNHNYNELNNEDTPVNRKRQATSSTHNKTQKRMSDMQFDPEKVNHVLQSIHNNNGSNGTDNELGDFNPKRNQGSATQSSVPINPLNTSNKLLAPPVSMREKEDRKEGFHNNNNEANNLIPVPLDNAEMDLQELQSAFLNDAQVRDYYKKLVPNYNHKQGVNLEHSSSNKMHYKEQPSNLGSYGSNDMLLNKINYMINLLEDQQDERTNNVTEEVVLYSFLGIFIIFVVDSFARVGKYTR
jgi:TolA-binding protein